MEEQGHELVEFKHVCKFCKKSFPCGRSLGGHMRSHMIITTTNNNNNNSFDTDEKKSILNKPTINPETATQIGYGLRENPKKTCRFADSSEDTSLTAKFCKDCGKGFQSWKALFGHMRSHSEKERLSNSLEEEEEEEEEDSWGCANHKMVMDSQSDTETAVPNRKKRSRRRTTRYMAPATSSAFYFANNASSSVSEIEQEQEEVAISLMMLSRDSANWVGLNSVVTESSDNNSVFLNDESKSEVVKLKKKHENFELGGSRNDAKMNKSEVLQTNYKIEPSEIELGKKKMVKVKGLHQDESVLFSSGDKFSSSKRSKFECTTCNKTFHSYQALGGHRASHKKIKGCFASRIDSSENSVDPELSHDPTDDSHGRTASVCAEKAAERAEAKKVKGHECPICLKVFSSGQALGGHKRSHLVGGGDGRGSHGQTIVIPKPNIPEIRDFLDLNLPAPAEEDGGGGGGGGGFKPWWVGSSHKHEHLVGMISN